MITPFSYQESCLGCIDQARQQGEKIALVVMATRLGKTITAAFDVKRFRPDRKIRVLYLCHKTDILYQAHSDFQLVLGNQRSYGFFHGKEKSFHEVDCLFSSFDTIRNYIDIFDPEEFDYVIVDESHHSKAETYLPVIQHFRPKFLLGLTATPDRMDLQDITEIFGKPVFELPLEEALAKGYLTPLDYRILTDEIQAEKVLKTPDKLWSVSALNHQIFVPKRDEEIARIITWETSRIKDAKTIIFCSSVKHCDELVKLIPDSLTIHSKIPDKERDIRLEMFRQNMLNTVITVDCFNEGIDIPRANVIVFLRSTSSRTIFLQQLGRGLTKTDGKDKVIVLDFVANIERIRMVQDMCRKIKEVLPQGRRWRSLTGPPPIILEIGKVTFHERKIGLTDLLERILRKEPYLTWQEASSAAIALGIKTQREYWETGKWKRDTRLIATPNKHYEDFPGWTQFLGQEHYLSLEEASQAAKKLGIQSAGEYKKNYDLDPKLPSNPNTFYPAFISWGVFLGTGRKLRMAKNCYTTWQEAGKAARTLGITSREEYGEKYKSDPKLPSRPEKVYRDFPGIDEFLGRAKKEFYSTWQEASQASIRLGISSTTEYKKRCSEDPKLPTNPHLFYADYPGSLKFFSKKERTKPYKTCAAAAKAAQSLGIKGQNDYNKRYKENLKLPSAPHQYYKDFPGYKKFLGKD